MEVLRMLQARKLIGCVPRTGLIPSETKTAAGPSSYSCSTQSILSHTAYGSSYFCSLNLKNPDKPIYCRV